MSWRINQNHGCYRFGSSYPTQKRLQIIVTFLETLSIANTSRICRVSYNCVDQYVRLFQQRATLIPSVCNNVRPRQMTWWKAAYLEALVRMYPTLYLRELQQILASDFHLAPGDVPSIASIAKLFIRLPITRKKCIHVAQERMTPYNLHCRQLFFQWRRTVDPAKVYFFDETHFNCETDEREYGRTDSGFACPVLRQKSRARAGKFSTLGVCGFNEGVLQAIPVEGNFTADLITDVIENQVLPLLPANSYLVADNASVHNEIVLCRILARKNITLVKLPGYSYDLNPIEMVFGQAKAIARFTPGFLKENTMLAIVSAFEQISPLNVRHFYQRSWRVLL